MLHEIWVVLCIPPRVSGSACGVWKNQTSPKGKLPGQKLWNLIHCVGQKRAAVTQQNNFMHSVTSGRIHTQSQQSLRKLGEGLGPQMSSFLVMFLGRKNGQWVASWPDKYFALKEIGRPQKQYQKQSVSDLLFFCLLFVLSKTGHRN